MLNIVLPSLIILFVVHTLYRPPTSLIRYFQRRWPDILFHIETARKVVALTIDDAPSEQTAAILDLLQANRARATFFVIGSQISGNESILQRLVGAGNELGNHAMHDEPSRSLSLSQLQSQIQAVDNILEGVYQGCGKPMPNYFRPGSGFFSTQMRALVRSMGYRMILGSIFPFDPQVPFWRINAWHTLSMLRPGGIIICHDRRAWTVPMLQNVLPEIKKRGYEVVTIGELLDIKEEL